MYQRSVNSYFFLILFTFMTPFTSQAAKPLNDAEIAEVMEVCRKIRFDFATIALAKAESDEVKDFASYILTDYKEELSPVPIFIKDQNQSASDIKKEMNELSADLKKLKGKEFDQSYLQMQMNLHKRIVKDIEDGLIPAAKNPELKKALKQTKAQFEDYVDDTLDAYISISK